MPADTGPVGTTSGGSGFWDTLSGLWGDFEGWASEPANQKILLGGGSALVANVLKNKGLLDSDAAKVGYQGKIPDYTVRRTPIQYEYDPNRRPGSAGRRYFSDVEYIPGTGGVASVVQPEIDVNPGVTNPGVTNPGDTTPQLPDTPLPYYEDLSTGYPSYDENGEYIFDEGEPPRMMDPMPYDNYDGPREGDVKEEPPRLSDPLPYYEGEPPRMMDPMPYDNYDGPREGDVKEEPPRLPDTPLPYYEGEPPRMVDPLPYYDGEPPRYPPRLSDPLPYYKGEPPRLSDPLPYYDGPREEDVALLKERLTAGGTAIENMFKNKYAEGGIAQLSEGRYLKGETDGMADEVPASIDGQEPAALSDGEFVIPADIVSHLGNGNSEAGAKALKEMMSRIRGERTGNNEQGKQIDPNNFLLA